MTNQQKYGTTLVEFFKHSDDDLQQLIKTQEARYFRHCESLAYPQLGVNVDWLSEKVMVQALNDLTEMLLKGYTVAASTANAPLYLKLQLRKPQSLIDADLIKLSEQAKLHYDKDRHALNVAEQARQVDIGVARQMRDAEAKAAKAAADILATAQEVALADLLAAYSKPKTPAKRAEAA